MSDALISLQDVAVSYREDVALRGIDLPSGAMIVLVSSLIFLVINAFSPRRRVKDPMLLTEVEESAS